MRPIHQFPIDKRSSRQHAMARLKDKLGDLVQRARPYDDFSGAPPQDAPKPRNKNATKPYDGIIPARDLSKSIRPCTDLRINDHPLIDQAGWSCPYSLPNDPQKRYGNAEGHLGCLGARAASTGGLISARKPPQFYKSCITTSSLVSRFSFTLFAHHYSGSPPHALTGRSCSSWFCNRAILSNRRAVASRRK